MNVEFYTGIDERLDVPMILPPVPELVDLESARMLIADVQARSAKTMGGPVVCCDDGEKCTCGLYWCDYAAEPCVCTDVGVSHVPASSCTGATCCASEGGLCGCGTGACGRGQVQVASCSVETSLCESWERRVEKCVPR